MAIAYKLFAVATILASVCGVVDPWATLESSVPLKLRGQRKMSRFRLLMVALSLFHVIQVAKAQEKPIAIVAGTIIDGSGKVLHNQAILVQGSKIVSIG